MLRRGGLGALGVLAVGGALLGGCERKLTADDCRAVRARIETAWLEDANAAATSAENEQVRRFVKDEATRLGDEWMKQCAERVGSEITDRELGCLKRVEHIDDVARCAVD